MLGVFKSMFGKSSGNPYEKYSSEELLKQKAEREARVTDLKRKLPTAALAVGQEKSEAWRTQKLAEIETAKGKGWVDDVIRLEAELRAGSKAAGRVSQHADEMEEAILKEEDQIELIDRVLGERA